MDVIIACIAMIIHVPLDGRFFSLPKIFFYFILYCNELKILMR